VHRFLTEPSIAPYAATLGPAAVKAAVDAVLGEARAGFAPPGALPPFQALVAGVRLRLARAEAGGLVEVLNGTGILLHTNLGRAPLGPEALDAVATLAGGYSNLEFDLETGTRGSRYERVSGLLAAVSGAEDALVVNNCAAALLLVLDAFARSPGGGERREVVVSRNQLVEIGGGFRLPDVLERSGAQLVEVGTTNRVYLRDFERALTPRTALLLRSHASNYRIEGFVADVAPADLAALGRRAGIASLEDLGSGALVDLTAYGLPHERTVREAVGDGFDLVAFSGDKLLGGPQAGIVVGRRAAIARLRASPLLRALRVDKATLAALGATLRLYLEPGGVARIPFFAMLGASVESLRARSAAICAGLGVHADRARLAETQAFAGGGALPLAPIVSAGVAVAARDPNAFAAALLRERPALAGRCEGRDFVVDLRAIPAPRDGDVIRALALALARE
jgi:L-seryl-tRNA(Ser) seleniumtransferase